MKVLLILIAAGILYWFWSHGISGGLSSAAPAYTPMAAASSVEQDYYRKVFDYTMTVTPEGQSYAWETYNAKGAITPGKAFTSKSQSTCRSFHETLTANGEDKAAEGVACKRNGAEGWCRLKTTDAQTCAMETPSGVLGGLKLGTGDAIENGKGLWGKVTGFVR